MVERENSIARLALTAGTGSPAMRFAWI